MFVYKIDFSLKNKLHAYFSLFVFLGFFFFFAFFLFFFFFFFLFFFGGGGGSFISQ